MADAKARLDSKRQGRVLVLTLSNPSQRNALHPDMYRAGAETFAAVSDDDGIGAVVLTGAGDHFCSGGNLNRLRDNRQQPPSVQRQSVAGLHRWVRALNGCCKPVLAAVEGHAAGAGFSLALACDLVVAAESARFTMAYVKAGLSPDGGATSMLARALPLQLASEILLDGKPLAAERLHQLGVVNRLCATGGALQQAIDWAEKLASGPPSAQGRIKRLLAAAYNNDVPTQLDRERDALVESVFDDECGEGIAAFLEKRKPRFVD